jgi:hypothetical protein
MYNNERGTLMNFRPPGIASVAIAASLAAVTAANAHHSFAMFDQANKIDLEGVVSDYKFVAPHSYIFLDVKPKDGDAATWILEGASPSALERGGWSKTSLKPGDEIKVQVAPLKSGAPGGAWVPEKIEFSDGRPIIADQHALPGGQ